MIVENELCCQTYRDQRESRRSVCGEHSLNGDINHVIREHFSSVAAAEDRRPRPVITDRRRRRRRPYHATSVRVPRLSVDPPSPPRRAYDRERHRRRSRVDFLSRVVVSFRRDTPRRRSPRLPFRATPVAAAAPSSSRNRTAVSHVSRSATYGENVVHFR